MHRLPDFGITGWSWLNALGQHAHLVDAPPSAAAPDLLARSGLAPQSESLGLPGLWGRVTESLPTLPSDMLSHRSRCAELLFAALAPLRPALEQARTRYGADRVAVVLGSSTGGIDATERALAHERATGKMPDDFVFEEAHVYNALVCLVRESLGVNGVGFVISTACSSAGKALGAAQRLLDAGLADAVLTGGVDALCEMTLRGFAGLGILSAEGCRPFDARRNGISIGEGAALLLVERDSESPFRLLGVGESNDAYHATAPHPEGLGARLAMTRALEVAGLAPSDVDYVNAHGTGTEQNDSAEARAIAEVFGPGVRFSSTKDRVGHQLGTAGATEALFCLHALHTGRLPANRVPDVVDETLVAQPLTQSVRGDFHVAQSNSFAFGGSNVSVLLGKTASGATSRDGARSESVLSSAPPLRFFVLGADLWADGFTNARAWLDGVSDPSVDKPESSLLPARQRGRASPLTRLLAELHGRWRDDARFDEQNVSLFVGSAYGEMTTTLALLDQLGVDATLSPAKFQSSVHNTAAGLLTLNANNRGFSTAIAAGASTFAMTLVDGLVYLNSQGGSASLLVADEPGPRRMLRGKTFPALGIGLHVIASAEAPEGALAELSLPVRSASRAAPDVSGALVESPAAWGLPLLRHVLTTPVEESEIVIGPTSSIRVRPA